MDILVPNLDDIQAEMVETTLVVSQFGFLRVQSLIFKLRVIILPEMQILKVSSRIFDFIVSFLVSQFVCCS